MTAARLVAVVAAILVSAAPAWAQVKVGDTPKIQATTLDGKAVTNAELKDRLVIVDFWATWCGPCRQQVPHMIKLSKDNADKGVAILGISLDRDAAAPAKFAKEQGMTWPQVLDVGGKMSNAWGVTGIPRTFILAPDGSVVWQGHPAQIDAPLAAAIKKYPAMTALRAKATAALQAAGKALTGEKSVEKALAEIKTVPEGVTPDVALTRQAQQLATALAATPAGKQALADDADAVKTLTALGAKVPAAATKPAGK